MGCCLSREEGRSEVKEQALRSKRSPVTEVETVKEVLLSESLPIPATNPASEIGMTLLDKVSSVKAFELEQVKEAEEASPEKVEAPTPAAKPVAKIGIALLDQTSSVKADKEASPAKAEALKIGTVVEKTKSLKQALPIADEASDASEAYSFNESRSTTTVTEIRDDADDLEVGSSYVKHRTNNRSPTQRPAPTARPSNRQPQSRNGAVSRSKHRPEWNQSPCRKPSSEVRRNVRESPVRRTVSPAAGRTVTRPRPVNRGPTGPDRVGHGRMEETLENPLVSLECFIFL